MTESIFYLMIFLLPQTKYTECLKLMNCSSNRIHEVSREGMKAVIRYDDTEEIKFAENSDLWNVKIWCKVNGVIDRCILEKTSESKKICEYSYPPKCPTVSGSTCENNRIEYNAGDSKKCEFTFTKMTADGKKSNLNTRH